MTDILTLVFRTFMSQKSAEKETCSQGAYNTLVVGDREISRSVLLLAAVTAASEMGIKVVFFTQSQIQSLPVSLQRCFPNLTPDSLKKIKFCYPRTLEELLLQVASLHESTHITPTPPSLVIVDRLEDFLRGQGAGSDSGYHSGEPSCAAHISALLSDTATFLTRVLEQLGSGSGPCRLITSYFSNEDAEQASKDASATDSTLDVLDRYFQARCTLNQSRGYQAAAAGVQEVWHIYLSGRGVTEDGQEDGMGVVQEWQLFVSTDGIMEFKLA